MRGRAAPPHSGIHRVPPPRVKQLYQFLFCRKMLTFNTEFLALEMSSDVQEKSSRLKVKTNPGLRISGSTAKDNDNYSYRVM